MKLSQLSLISCHYCDPDIYRLHESTTTFYFFSVHCLRPVCFRLRLHYYLVLRCIFPGTPTRVVFVVRCYTYYIMPLKGIPFILSPDLLYVLSAAGHGDEIGK